MQLLSRTLLTAAVLLSALISAQAQHSAVTSAPRNDQWWKDRAKLLDDRLKETPDTRVLFIGDSITQGWEGDGKDAWARHFAKHKAVNLGIGGDRTQHVLWRLENAPLDGVKPQAAVVMIGTNNSNGEDNSPGQIADGVAAIVQTLRKRLPETKILLLGIFPRSENFTSQRGKITQVNQVIHKLHDGKNVFYLDIGHRFLASDGSLPADIMPDYLHLSPKGYQIWAEAIEEPLGRLMSGSGNSAAANSVSGEWIFGIRGPNDELVEFPLVLKVDGAQLSGYFQTEGRQFALESGFVDGDQVKFKARRQRSQGGELVYDLVGKLDGKLLAGKVTTSMEGSQITQNWSARRK
jgi:lysophospholipase L1-like esterase